MIYNIGDEITVEKCTDRRNTLPNGLDRWMEDNDAYLEYVTETENTVTYVITLEAKEIRDQRRIGRLKQMLADTDYKALKYAEGQISENEYAPIKAQRQTWRDEINELEEELSSMDDIQE